MYIRVNVSFLGCCGLGELRLYTCCGKETAFKLAIVHLNCFDLLTMVMFRLQEIVELDGAALTDRVKQLTGLWRAAGTRAGTCWNGHSLIWFPVFWSKLLPPWTLLAGEVLSPLQCIPTSAAGCWMQSLNRKWRWDKMRQSRQSRVFDHVWPIFLMLVVVPLEHEHFHCIDYDLYFKTGNFRVDLFQTNTNGCRSARNCWSMQTSLISSFDFDAPKLGRFST